LQNLVVLELDGARAPVPQFIGGFAFQPGLVDSALWRGFGDALFVLPRITYTRCVDRAWLTLCASANELARIPGRARLAQEAHEEGRVEHAIVVREIRALLEPLCATLRADPTQVHLLRHVAHLRTRFEGILAKPHHVLDLVARLHPTPALGGAPRAAALAWLAAHEHIERGLYAGPFGAFDRAGNGEFAVAIRSGLFAAGEAQLFAGAGIIEGSAACSELCETRWKLRSLLSAIGIG
jgi:isochorismate synthase EntC